MPTGGSWPTWRWAQGWCARCAWRARTRLAGEPPAVDAVPVPLLRGVAAEVGGAAGCGVRARLRGFAVDNRILSEAGFDGDLVRVTGHYRSDPGVAE